MRLWRSAPRRNRTCPRRDRANGTHHVGGVTVRSGSPSSVPAWLLIRSRLRMGSRAFRRSGVLLLGEGHDEWIHALDTQRTRYSILAKATAGSCCRGLITGVPIITAIMHLGRDVVNRDTCRPTPARASRCRASPSFGAARVAQVRPRQVS
jgi:hypothetical protein